jgi:hypothetical protein
VINQFLTRKYLSNQLICYVIVVTAFALLFIISLKNEQCCDTLWYELDRESLKSKAKLHFEPGFADAHNYLYPFFLLIIDLVGLNSRLEIGLVQIVIQLISIHYSAKMLSKTLLLPFSRTFFVISIIFIYPIYAYSSYTLTESITASLYLLFCSSFLSIIQIDSIKTLFFRNIFLVLTFTSSMLWMMRPNLFWIVIVALFLLVYKVYFKNKAELSIILKFKHTMLYFILSIFIFLPQYFVSSSETSLVGKYFKTTLLSSMQLYERSVYRYFTNLSECGPVSFLFSPYAQTIEEVYTQKSEQVPILSLIGLISRFSSGWDYYPQVTPYITSLDQNYFKFFVFFSGLMLSSPFFIAKSLKVNSEKSTRHIFYGLLSLALITQAQNSLQHGELRYNLVGYITFGLFLVVFRIKRRFVPYWLFSSTLIGLLLYLVSHRTYNLNETFILCLG